VKELRLFFFFGAGERERGGEQVLLTSVQGCCANNFKFNQNYRKKYKELKTSNRYTTKI